MKRLYKILGNTLFTSGILVFFFVVSLVMQRRLNANSLIPAVFVLGVFLISLFTDGYVYGIVASLVSVLMVNYAFTYPIFAFNFSIPENMISAVIMLLITILSSMVTTRSKNQEKIKAEHARERMRANLLRAISHDLRTPLTTICGASETIVENAGEMTNEELVRLSKGISEDSKWLISMVENLLTITRIDNDGVKVQKKSVVLEELIDTVLNRFKKRYPSQKVFVDIPVEFIGIPMDSVLIEQVIVNLLENAVLHAVGMTRLSLKVSVKNNNAIFEIEDDGCGISPEKRENIFAGYMENNIHIDHQKKSMGIGLSVCASIIRAHEGTITVESGTNGGCKFIFTLAMEEDDHE